MLNDLERRFWEKVDKRAEDKCWEWTGGTSRGYGKLKFGCITLTAHKVSWFLLHGLVPKGKLVLHKCDNRSCMNPKHLYIGTHSDNMHDKVLRNPGNPGRPLKFRNGEVWLMKRLRSNGVSRKTIAVMFECCHQTVWNYTRTEASFGN